METKRVGQVVVDTSAVLAVLMGEPARDAVLQATRRVTLLAAPSLPWEIGNALVALVRRRRIRAHDVPRAWSAYRDVPVRFVEFDTLRALELGLEMGLYAYDAYVLQAAQAAHAPLLTLDGRQRDAARGAGIAIWEAR
jgi:predicted nucleic acid-binding protein